MTLHPNKQTTLNYTSKVSSLTQQCLNNLRKGNSSIIGKRTHLLGFMSQYIQDKQEIKVQQVDEFCCYQRMKKLLIKQQDSKQERNHQQKVLNKAIKIQSKINQMQKQLRKRVSLSKNSLKKDGSCSQVLQKSHSQHFSYKKSAIQVLKKQSYEKFFQFQKIKKQTNVNKIKTIIGQQFQSAFQKAINQKDTINRSLNDQKKVLERKILQKNVQLEIVKSDLQYNKNYVKQLEEKVFGAINQRQNAHLIANYQKWIEQYKQAFGQLSVSELKRYIDDMKNKCLGKFNQLSNQNSDKLQQMQRQTQSKLQKMRKQIQKLQKRQNQLKQINKNLKLNKQISQMQINSLICSKQQLKSLQSAIIHHYNKWYSQRTQNQKTNLKQFNKLKDNYSYEEMLEYVVFYKQKLSTNDKLNQYILKILRGVQKIRRSIFPLQGNDKLDPFLVIDKIDKWVINRINKEQKEKLQQNNQTISINNTNQNINSSNEKHKIKEKSTSKGKDELNRSSLYTKKREIEQKQNNSFMFDDF